MTPSKVFKNIDNAIYMLVSKVINRPKLLKLVVYGLIVSAVVLGLIIRTASFKLNGYEFFEFDSYIEYWQAKYVYENGPLAWYSLTRDNSITHIFWYPWGRDFIYTSYPFLPIWIGTTYHVVQVLGLTLQQWAAMQPVLFAIFAIFVAYFATVEVTGNRLAGIMASYLSAVLPAAVERSVIGYVEKEGVSALFIFLFILFYSKGLKKTYTAGIGWLRDVVLASLFLSLVGWLWGGYIFILGTVVLYFILSPILSLRFVNKNFVIYNLLLLILSFVFILPSPSNARLLGLIPFSIRGLGWVLMGASLLPVMYFFLGIGYKKIGLRKPIITQGLYLLIFIGLIIAGALLTILGILPIGGRLAWALGLRFISVEPLVESIAEHQSPLADSRTLRQMLHSWGVFFEPLVLLSPLFMSVFGAIYLLYKGTPEKSYLAVAFAVAFYSYLNAVYMISSAAYFGVIAVSSITAVVAYYVFPYIYQPVKDKKRIKPSTRSVKVGRTTRVVMLLLFAAILANIAYTGYTDYQQNSKMVYTFKAGVSGLGYSSDSWYRAISIIQSLPEEAVVIAWWDYGYGISVPGGRASVADGSTLNNTQIGMIGLIMLSSTTEQAARIAKLFNVKPNMTYLMIIEGAIIVEKEDKCIIRPIVLGGAIPGIVDWPKSVWMIKIGNSVVDELRKKNISVDYIDTTKFLYLYYNQYTGETYLSPPLNQPEKTPLIYKILIDAMLYWSETRGKTGEFYWFTGTEQQLPSYSDIRQRIKNAIGLDVSVQISITGLIRYEGERPLINDTILQPHAVIVDPFVDPEKGEPLRVQVYIPDYGWETGIVHSVILIYRFTNIPD